MNYLINYEEYQNNGGIALPIITTYDESLGITTPEDKFKKWLIYTQIQLNYILQDKLKPASYNMLNIDERFREDIRDILVTRLNRSFENDELIPRNSNFQYSEGGSISSSYSAMSEEEGWSFWNSQEKKMIETSGLRKIVNLRLPSKSSEYPITLAIDLMNRLLSSDGSIGFELKNNPTNNLTAIDLKVVSIPISEPEFESVFDKNKLPGVVVVKEILDFTDKQPIIGMPNSIWSPTNKEYVDAQNIIKQNKLINIDGSISLINNEDGTTTINANGSTSEEPLFNEAFKIVTSGGTYGVHIKPVVEGKPSFLYCEYGVLKHLTLQQQGYCLQAPIEPEHFTNKKYVDQKILELESKINDLESKINFLMNWKNNQYNWEEEFTGGCAGEGCSNLWPKSGIGTKKVTVQLKSKE